MVNVFVGKRTLSEKIFFNLKIASCGGKFCADFVFHASDPPPSKILTVFFSPLSLGLFFAGRKLGKNKKRQISKNTKSHPIHALWRQNRRNQAKKQARLFNKAVLWKNSCEKTIFRQIWTAQNGKWPQERQHKHNWRTNKKDTTTKRRKSQPSSQISWNKNRWNLRPEIFKYWCHAGKIEWNKKNLQLMSWTLSEGNRGDMKLFRKKTCTKRLRSSHFLKKNSPHLLPMCPRVVWKRNLDELQLRHVTEIWPKIFWVYQRKSLPEQATVYRVYRFFCLFVLVFVTPLR